MKTIAIAFRYLWSRPLAALLNLLLLSLGLACVTFVLLVSAQVNRAFERDLAGIDMVVGAKGSPLQLILAGVFHIDVPPGNIPLAGLEALRKHPQVERVVPLSLGDSFQGHRVVGTGPEFLAHYGLRLASGKLWNQPMEAVVGANVAQATGLRAGLSFIGSHGLAAGGAAHGDRPWTVTGVLEACGCVADRMIVTATESVWAVHEEHAAEPPAPAPTPATSPAPAAVPLPVATASAPASTMTTSPGTATTVTSATAPAGTATTASTTPAHTHAHEHEPEPKPAATFEKPREREVTLALVRYNTPLAAASLPRWVNSQTTMQAAAPAVEVTRLARMLGVGGELLRGLGAVLLGAAALSMFIALWNAVRERREDLAMLRMLGATPFRVALLLVAEAFWLALLASLMGLAAGHLLAELAGAALAAQQSLPLTGLLWLREELWIPAAALGVAFVAALVPAISASRLDVAQLLNAR